MFAIPSLLLESANKIKLKVPKYLNTLRQIQINTKGKVTEAT